MENTYRLEDLVAAMARQYGLFFPETLEEFQDAEEIIEAELGAEGGHEIVAPTPDQLMAKRQNRTARNTEQFKNLKSNEEGMSMAARSGGTISDEVRQKMNKDRDKEEKKDGK